MLKTGNPRFWEARIWCLAFLLAAVFPALAKGKEPTVEELKVRLSGASVAERPGLCIQISELQLGYANRLYSAGDSEKAQAALADVVAFSELARDYSIQSHKHEKQSEIAIRKMIRKLADLKHTVALADQKPLQDAIGRLEKTRDDLLSAMFPKGDKR
jgi:hypothetical protein